MRRIYLNKKYVFTFVISLAIFTLNFFQNTWNTTNPQWFNDFQKDSESLVIGKMITSKKYGIFSEDMFLGWWVKPNQAPNFDDQYKILNGTINEQGYVYSPYRNQMGLQGLVFSIFDKIINYEQDLKFDKFITSFMLALLLAYFVFWVYFEFGLMSAVIIIITTVFSQWITVFGRNLYWVIWTMYLPIIGSLFFLHIESFKKKYSSIAVFLFVFFAIMIKCANGYEYISTILISTTIPFIYYSYSNDWGLKKFLKRTATVSIAGILGFIVTILMHAWQLSLKTGSYSSGLEIIKFTILKRTHGSSEQLPEAFKASLESSTFEVIYKYLKGSIFEFSNFLNTEHVFKITFENLIFVFSLITALVFISEKYSKSIAEDRKKLIGLTLSVWVSVLAPLSWYVLAKAHSFIHVHINTVLWHLPFTFFGFTLLGAVIYKLVNDLYRNHKIFRFTFISIIGISLIIGIAYFITSKINNNINTNNLLRESTNIIDKTDLDVYLNKDKLIYVNYNKSNTDEKYFLHIYPSIGKEVLPPVRQQYGYDNLDFRNSKKFPTSLFSSKTIKVINLPDYPIDKIATGQYTEKERLWEKEININQNQLNIEPISDNQWDKGLLKNGHNILLFKHTKSNELIFNKIQEIEVNNLIYKIINIEYLEPNWIHVKIDRPIQDEIYKVNFQKTN